MRASPRWIAAGALSLLVACIGAARLLWPRKAESVATIEVHAGRFVREVTAGGTLRAVKATSIVVPVESGRQQRVAALAEDGASLKAGDLVVEFDPWDARREAADGTADLASAQAKIEKSVAEGGKTSRSLSLDRDVAREDLERARAFQATDERLFSRNAIIESRLDRELYTRKADVAGHKLETSGKLSAADHALGEIEAGKARLKLASADKSLRSLRILAPHDGLLVLERNWRGEATFVGDSLWPGEKIGEIPDLSRLEARVFVLEADAAGLKPGLTARASIEGRPGADYAASVSRVEPVAKSREQQSPVKYFETTLSLERTDPELMKPGQRVRALIRLEEAEGVIAIPRGALFERDGRRVVYRREGAGFVPVDVTVGRNSVSRVVVETGLREGDRVALRDPSLETRAASLPGAPGAGPGQALK
jgi:HlyD family secretion protein